MTFLFNYDPTCLLPDWIYLSYTRFLSKHLIPDFREITLLVALLEIKLIEQRSELSNVGMTLAVEYDRQEVRHYLRFWLNSSNATGLDVFNDERFYCT